jgi:hypothetical protein
MNRFMYEDLRDRTRVPSLEESESDEESRHETVSASPNAARNSEVREIRIGSRTRSPGDLDQPQFVFAARVRARSCRISASTPA